MPINLSAAMARAKITYEELTETTPMTFEWWSLRRDSDFGEVNEDEFVRHPDYPTIRGVTTPSAGGNNVFLPMRLDTISHQGSFPLEYHLNDDLLEVNQMKRGDKLVCVENTDQFRIVDVHSSAGSTHVVVGLLHQEYWRYAEE